MKIVEITLGTLLIISLILKILHIPGGAMLCVLFATILSTFYFAASFFIFKSEDKIILVNDIPHKQTNTLRILGSVATGISLSTTLIGILFRIMHWPGAAAMLIIGFTSLLIIGSVSLFKYSKTKESYYTKIGLRVVIFGIAAAIAFVRYI